MVAGTTIGFTLSDYRAPLVGHSGFTRAKWHPSGRPTMLFCHDIALAVIDRMTNLDCGPLSEDVFDLAQRGAALGPIFYRGHSFEFLQQLALTFVELARSLHPHFDEQIALAVSIEHRHAFAPDAERRA